MAKLWPVLRAFIFSVRFYTGFAGGYHELIGAEPKGSEIGIVRKCNNFSAFQTLHLIRYGHRQAI